MDATDGDSAQVPDQPSPTTAALRRQFYEGGRDDFLTGTRRGAWLGIFISLAGYLLDYLMFRSSEAAALLDTIVALRILAAGMLLLVLFLLYQAKSMGMIRVLAHAVAMIPMFVLDWVLVEIGTAGSPYYAGLNLIMVASLLLLRWPLIDAVINTLFCIGGYLAVAVGLGTPVAEIGVAWFFLTCTGMLVCLGAYMLNSLRFRDYCTGRELDAKNRELGEALEELHANEVRLLQAEKLSSLGRMSAGIVHEINNPLNYTVTALHTLGAYADDLPEAEREDYIETVGDAEEGVGRVIKIVSDLRSFTKGELQVWQEVVLAGVVEAARRLVSHDLRGIDFRVDVPEEMQVLGNDNQLCQVFVNLVQNASQAVITAKDRGVDPQIVVRATEQLAGDILVTIRDNGCGIPKTDIENIFDPFFTKRQVGDGMGLGLSICHSILQAHGARVDVTSEPDQFTEFALHFPSIAARREIEAKAKGITTEDQD